MCQTQIALTEGNYVIVETTVPRNFAKSKDQVVKLPVVDGKGRYGMVQLTFENYKKKEHCQCTRRVRLIKD